MTSAFTRRGLIAATPAVVGAAAIPAGALPLQHDTELLALRPLWLSTVAGLRSRDGKGRSRPRLRGGP